jgi:hypothetical protein
MNTAYLIYQAERPKTAAEQRQIDRSHGELAKSLARLLRPAARPRPLSPKSRSAHGVPAVMKNRFTWAARS